MTLVLVGCAENTEEPDETQEGTAELASKPLVCGCIYRPEAKKELGQFKCFANDLCTRNRCTLNQAGDGCQLIGL